MSWQGTCAWMHDGHGLTPTHPRCNYGMGRVSTVELTLDMTTLFHGASPALEVGPWFRLASTRHSVAVTVPPIQKWQSLPSCITL